MPIIFPPIETASPEGLLAIGGSLDEETLLTAYRQGIFPWPISADSPLTWFSPDPRGILYTEEFHCSKSFIKFLKTTTYEVKFNTNFESVLNNCAMAVRKHETGTWITQEIMDGYLDFFNTGHAYCVEVYDEGILIGGLYGVAIGKYVSGESMFHLKDNASKVALYALIGILKKNKISMLDTQMVTPIIESMGGKNISRSSFQSELNLTVKDKLTRDELFNFKFNDLSF